MPKTRGGRSAGLVAIVDDDALVRRSTRRLVRAFGFDAEAFGSAEEFLHSGTLAKTTCLILDVRMPGMGGLDLQRRLAAREPRIPIVFLTAHATDLEEREARRAGAAALLRKPVGRDALLTALRAVLGEPATANGRGGTNGRHWAARDEPP
jgi:FixJ family two-component response regulator